MRKRHFLIVVALSLFSHNEQHPLLQEPLACFSHLLIHHLADHLTWKGIAMNCLCFFDQGLLTKQSTAQHLLQGTQPLLLIKLSHPTEPLESQLLSQHSARSQQRPGGRSEPSELGANQLTHA